MSATEKLAGFFDPNVPARRNAAKVKCADCKEEIVYDFSEFLVRIARSYLIVFQYSAKTTCPVVIWQLMLHQKITRIF